MTTTRRVARSVICLLALTGAGVPPGIAASEEASADLQSRLEAFVGLVPAAAAAITVRDGATTTAATGILDDRGGMVDPQTPFLLGPLGLPMTSVIVLQLVDEGRVELDEPISTYLPSAPVADDATVRDLLDWRAGVPDHYGLIIDRTLADPSHGWTREELIDLIDPTEVGIAGDYSPSIGHEIVSELLVEAVEGVDFGTALAQRISEPLGLTSTLDFAGDESPPAGLAVGWELDIGLAGDRDAELSGWRTIDGRTSSVADLATFLTALVDGQLLSDEMTAVMFDEEAVFHGMGFDAHDSALGDLGDLGTRYYASSGSLVSGYAGSLAVSPETGDIVVVLASNDDLHVWELVREMISEWATGS